MSDDAVEDRMSDELASAIKTALHTGDTADLHATFDKHAGTKQTVEAALVWSVMLEIVVSSALIKHSRMQATVAELQATVAELQARPAGGGVKYAGVYNPQTRYEGGALVTRSGGLWLAQRDSIAETPGASTGWLLIVKRGDV